MPLAWRLFLLHLLFLRHPSPRLCSARAPAPKCRTNASCAELGFSTAPSPPRHKFAVVVTGFIRSWNTCIMKGRPPKCSGVYLHDNFRKHGMRREPVRPSARPPVRPSVRQSCRNGVSAPPKLYYTSTQTHPPTAPTRPPAVIEPNPVGSVDVYFWLQFNESSACNQEALRTMAPLAHRIIRCAWLLFEFA